MNRDAAGDDNFYKWTENILKGKDGAPETEAAFRQMESLFKDRKLNIPPERQAEIMKALYSVRMGITGKNFKPLTEAAQNFIETETAGILSKAQAAFAKSGKINEKQFNAILEAGNSVRLDAYLFKDTVPYADNDGYGFETKAAALGGGGARAVMDTVVVPT